MTFFLPIERGELKRGMICRAALSLFAEKGFHGTTVPDIVRTGRIALGTFYAHFESKEALVNEIYRECRKVLNGHLEAKVDKAASKRERFRQSWRALISFAVEYSDGMMFLLQFHAPYLDDKSRAVEDVPAPLVRLVAELSPTLKPLPAGVLASVVWGIFLECLREHLRSERPLGPKAFDRMEACAWDAIQK